MPDAAEELLPGSCMALNLPASDFTSLGVMLCRFLSDSWICPLIQVFTRYLLSSSSVWGAVVDALGETESCKKKTPSATSEILFDFDEDGRTAGFDTNPWISI